MNDSNLMLIASQPRSGSTLLQKIISNTAFINTVSEHWLLLPFLAMFKTEIQKSDYDAALAAEVVQEFLKKFDLEKIFIEEQKKFLLKLYKPLLKDGVVYILDKTPRYYEILNELVKYFPGAKIIILIRDPIDVLQSVIQTWKVKSLRGLDYYARDILIAPVLLDKFCNEQANNKNVIKLYYEDLVKDPEKEVREIFNWLQLPFEPAILDFEKNEKTSGKRGDPAGVYRYKKIVTKSEKNNDDKAYAQVWKNFIKGYKFYLKNSALSNFRRYNFDDGKSTAIFKYYFKLNNTNTGRRKLTVKDVFIYAKTKLATKRTTQ